MSTPGEEVGTEHDYEPGDVNVVDAAEAPTGVGVEYEDGDVNTLAPPAGVDRGAHGGVANRAEAPTASAVLTYLAQSLADDPDAVVVRSEDRRGSVVLRLHVAPDDMGRVIGRRGRTAQAIRTLVGVAGARDDVRTIVDIVDD